VEGLAPAVLVEVGDEGVELVHELRGGQDALPDALAALLIEKLVVRVDAGVDEILGHSAGLAAERVEGVLAEPRDFHGEIRGAGDARANRHPLHRGVLQLGDDVADDGGRSHLERNDVRDRTIDACGGNVSARRGRGLTEGLGRGVLDPKRLSRRRRRRRQQKLWPQRRFVTFKTRDYLNSIKRGSIAGAFSLEHSPPLVQPSNFANLETRNAVRSIDVFRRQREENLGRSKTTFCDDTSTNEAALPPRPFCEKRGFF